MRGERLVTGRTVVGGLRLPGTDSLGGTLAAIAERHRSISAHRARARPSPTIAKDRGSDWSITTGTTPRCAIPKSSAVVDFGGGIRSK